MFNSAQTHSYEKRGKWVYMAYCEVEKKYGAAIAKQIRKDKKELEAARSEDEEPWYCPHPEIKNTEEIWISFSIVLKVFKGNNCWP